MARSNEPATQQAELGIKYYFWDYRLRDTPLERRSEFMELPDEVAPELITLVRFPSVAHQFIQILDDGAKMLDMRGWHYLLKRYHPAGSTETLRFGYRKIRQVRDLARVKGFPGLLVLPEELPNPNGELHVPAPDPDRFPAGGSKEVDDEIS